MKERQLENLDNAMDIMYQKIKDLDSKMEELQQIVYELNQQVKLLTSVSEQNHHLKSQSFSRDKDSIPNPIIEDNYDVLNLEHKDILVGGNSWQYNSYRYKQMGMTAEVEIRRLTAQLTAAYNRIAALEEQLLSKKNAEHKILK
jgi:predicted  nucleic acid-binding Zn-ribbon protein